MPAATEARMIIVRVQRPRSGAASCGADPVRSHADPGASRPVVQSSATVRTLPVTVQTAMAAAWMPRVPRLASTDRSVPMPAPMLKSSRTRPAVVRRVTQRSTRADKPVRAPWEASMAAPWRRRILRRLPVPEMPRSRARPPLARFCCVAAVDGGSIAQGVGRRKRGRTRRRRSSGSGLHTCPIRFSWPTGPAGGSAMN